MPNNTIQPHSYIQNLRPFSWSVPTFRQITFIALPFILLAGSLFWAWQRWSLPKYEVKLIPLHDQNKTLKEAWEKMVKNSTKAIKEHCTKNPSAPYFRELVIDPTKKQQPLTFRQSNSAQQGPRDTMEDCNFFKAIDQGIIAGVCDGHKNGNHTLDGAAVAQYVCTTFGDKFTEILSKNNDNVRLAFVKLIDQIHDDIKKNQNWNEIGTTAVICYVDKWSHIVYTATIGDSQANVYRQVNGQLKSIPLSCIRDWSHPKEAARAAKALNDPAITTKWPKKSGKHLRVNGLNVSRALGDAWATGTQEAPCIIHKPKLTMQQLFPGDKILLASDGFKDYVTEQQVIENLQNNPDAENFTSSLATLALNYYSPDNVTVVGITVS
jgi:serine/threonine protein phosphatase PrpC